MASAFEEAITNIQLSDYASRMFIDLHFPCIDLTDIPSCGRHCGYI